MHVKTRVAVNVGLTKQVLAIGYGEARLFFHLASHAFFGRLADVRKATGKVERALAWFSLRRSTSSSPLALIMKATFALLGLRKYSKPQLLQILLFSLFSSKRELPQLGQYLNFSNGCISFKRFVIRLQYYKKNVKSTSVRTFIDFHQFLKSRWLKRPFQLLLLPLQ